MPDQEIDVKTGFGKRGMYTGGAKKGFGNSTYGHLFSKPFEYISDSYDNKRNQEIVNFCSHQQKHNHAFYRKKKRVIEKRELEKEILSIHLVQRTSLQAIKIHTTVQTVKVNLISQRKRKSFNYHQKGPLFLPAQEK